MRELLWLMLSALRLLVLGRPIILPLRSAQTFVVPGPTITIPYHLEAGEVFFVDIGISKTAVLFRDFVGGVGVNPIATFTIGAGSPYPLRRNRAFQAPERAQAISLTGNIATMATFWRLSDMFV